jgi:hypothetical protein
MAAPLPPNSTYYVLNKGTVQGPYELPFIEALVLAGQLPRDVNLSKDGKIAWERLDVLTLPPLPPNRGAALPPGILLNDPPPIRGSVAPPATPRPSGGVKVPGCLITFAILVGIGAISSWLKQPSYQPPAYQPTAEPAAAQTQDPTVQQSTLVQPAADASTSPQAVPATTAFGDPVVQPTVQTPPPVTTYQMTGANGKLYRIPHSEYQILEPRKQQLDTTSTQIEKYRAYVDSLSTKVDADRASLDNTDATAVSAFNDEVDSYNAAHARLGTAIDSYNQSVDSYNADLDRYGTPVSQ